MRSPRRLPIERWPRIFTPTAPTECRSTTFITAVRADMGAEKDWPGVMHYLADLRTAGSVARGSRQYLLYPVWPRGKNPTGPSFDRYHSIDLARGPEGAQGSVVMRVAEDPKDPHFASVLEFKVMGMQEDDQLTLQRQWATNSRRK